ncbi:MAG: hypothetical protein N3A38_16640 [Planctomycetota bacterium]|nr:hypothetical protein [Planctomycetota bacterium]
MCIRDRAGAGGGTGRMKARGGGRNPAARGAPGVSAVASVILAAIPAALVAAPVPCADAVFQEVVLPCHGGSDSWTPSLAFGGGVYLAVWRADRNEKADIVGLRLDKDGKPLDPKPFVVCAARDCQERPKADFGGGVFLVVWHDLRNGKDWDVCAARVTPEGRVFDPGGFPVAGGELNQCEPSACWDGSCFQVLWRGFRGEKDGSPGVNKLPDAGYHIYGGRVSADGKLLDGAGVFMAKPPREYLTPRSMGAPAAILLPDGRLLATARSGTTQCLWKIAGGKPVSEPKLVSQRTGFDDPDFAGNGRTILMTWTTFRDGGGRSSGTDKSGMLMLGADGDPGKIAPASLSSAEREPRVRHPAPVWDGFRYVVAWNTPQRRTKAGFDYEAVFYRTFGADGAPLGADAHLAGTPESPAWRPAAASDGAGRTLIVYERHPEKTDAPVSICARLLSGAP